MNVREKLIGLIANAKYICANDYSDHTEDEYIADTLLDNGVTVQEWISVDDRLPEDNSDVLAYLRDGDKGRIYPANYAKGVWFDCIFDIPVTNATTHWMPLPELPKGE